MNHYHNLIGGLATIILLLLLSAGTASAQRRVRHRTRAATHHVAPKKKVAPAKKKVVAAVPQTNNSDTAELPANVNGKNFTVTSSFTPSLRVAPKINFSNTTALPSMAKVPLSYNVPAQSLFFTYESASLQPLAVNIDTASVWRNTDFVKLGYGNYSTPYLEGAFSFGDGYRSAVTLHALHTSSKGDLPLQQFSKTGIDASGVFALGENNQLDARAYYKGQNQFEYAHLLPDVNYDKDSLRRRYNDFGIKVGLGNKTENSVGVNYHPTVAIDAYSGNQNEHESTLVLDVPLEKKISDAFSAKLGLNADITTFKTDTSSAKDNVYSISPSIQYNKPNFKANIGVIPSVDNGQFHLLPNFTLETKLRDQRFIVQAGWIGYYNKNTYRSLTTFNPWIIMPNDLFTTRAGEFYGGFKGAAGDHFTYDAKVSFVQYHDLALFLNDTTVKNRTFRVLDESRINDLKIHGEIGYNSKSNFSLLAGLTINNYGGQKNYGEPWGLSPIELNGSLRWTVFKRVLLKSDVDIFNGAKYMWADGSASRLGGGVDWNIGAEVSIIKNLSAWLQVNNLLNDKYQRWANYPVLGTTVMGGIIFNFGQLK